MNWTSWANWWWAFWLLILFGVPEAVALATGHPEATLSDTVWRVFDIVPGKTPAQWTIGNFVVFGLLLWLLGHLAFHWWTHL